MRSFIINKILCLQYRLGRIIGRRSADRICILLDEAFTGLFGRETISNQGERKKNQTLHQIRKSRESSTN